MAAKKTTKTDPTMTAAEKRYSKRESIADEVDARAKLSPGRSLDRITKDAVRAVAKSGRQASSANISAPVAGASSAAKPTSTRRSAAKSPKTPKR